MFIGPFVEAAPLSFSERICFPDFQLRLSPAVCQSRLSGPFLWQDSIAHRNRASWCSYWRAGQYRRVVHETGHLMLGGKALRRGR